MVLALGLILAVAARMMVGNFENIETAATEQKAQQLYQAFNSDLRQLAISTRDYAQWDSAADYVNGSNPKFLVGNFTRETMSAMHVDLVWILDRDGNDIYTSYYDPVKDRQYEPAPAALLVDLRRVIRIDAAMNESQPIERLLRTHAGPVGFAAMEIRRTDLSGPTGAVMLFARYIDADDVERISETLRMTVHMDALGTAVEPMSTLLPSPVRQWIRGPHPASTMVWNSDRDQTTAYAMARDIDGDPLVLFSSNAPRSIYRLGLHATALMVGSILLLLLVGGSGVSSLIALIRYSSATQLLRIGCRRIR